MSRTNSAPNSPIIGSVRMNSPRINRSFRGEKDLGEISQRMRRLQPDGHKHRRADREEEEDDCCGGRSLAVPGPGCRAPLSMPGSPRTTFSRPVSPRPTLSVPGSPRSRSKSPGLSQKAAKNLPASPGLKRPTSLLTVANTSSSRRTPSPRTPTRTPSRVPSPRPAASPRASVSPRASPARKISSRGMSPSKTLRSPGTPTGEGGAVNLSDPEVLALIGNRAVKTVSKPSKNCDHCGRELTEDGCTAFGKVFHKECFRCHGCKKRLDGKFYSKDDNAYCAKCFKNTQEQCCVCKQKIVGDCVVNNKTFYHPGCMKCYVCEEPLRNAYLFFQNKPICEKHFKEAQGSCCVCGNVIEGTYYQLNDKIYCHEDYMAHMGDTCAKCSSSIEGEHVKITGSSFHPQCFNCEACDKTLVGMTFTTDEKNKVYCPECYTKLFAAQCCVCSKPIVPKEGQTKAPRIRALDRDFHPQCFKCEDCGHVLDSRIKGSECWPIRHHVLCYKCYRRRQSESESEGDD